MNGPVLALVEVLARDGSVRASHAVRQWPLRVGRALDNDVVLDDAHTAAQHLELRESANGGIEVQALPSLNGLRLGKQKLRQGQTAALATGAVLEAGHTRLRLRLASDSLAAERPLLSESLPRRTWLWLALFWAVQLFEHWLGTAPGDKATDWLAPALGVPFGVALWCLFWALGSKLFQGRFDFWGHLRLAAPVLFASALLAWLLPGLAGIFDVPALARIDDGLLVALMVYLIVRHASRVLPAQARGLATVGTVAFVVGAGIVMVLNEQRSDRYFSALYMASLPPPALRLAPLKTPEAFVQSSAALKAELDARAAKARADDGEEEAAEE